MIDYRILGPLEVSKDGRAIQIGGLKQRVLLAILLLRANQSVPRNVLVRELWGEQPPAGAQHTLDVYVSRLRKTLDAAAEGHALETRPGGYRLHVGDGQLDVHRFERLVAEGRRELAVGAPAQAAASLRAALALWRGQVLADLSDEPFARVEIARLKELRLGAIEDRIESDLVLGRHADLVGELKGLLFVHPLSERLRGQLMVALYRSGRQVEALEAYQSARRTLIDELGLEPSRALKELEHAILAQDGSLDPPARTAVQPPAQEPGLGRLAPGGIGRRPRLLVAAGAGLALVMALLAVGLSGGSARSTAGANTVGVIDGARAVLKAVFTGAGRPNGVAYGAGAGWATDSADGLLLRFSSAGIADRIPVGRGPAGVAVGDGDVWVANELDGTVSEVNPAAGRQVAEIRVGIGPDAIVFGYGSVWVADITSDTVSRINPSTDTVTATIAIGGSPNSIAAGAGSIWVTSQETGLLSRIDPADNRLTQTIAIGDGPDGVTVGAGSVWIVGVGGTLSRLNPRARTVRTTRIGGAPAGIAYADGAVWVANSVSGTVSRINQETGATRLVAVGNDPADLVAAGRDIWMTVLPSLTSHRGGTLTVMAQPYPTSPVLPSDPAVAYYLSAWQMLSMTNDGLVTYRRVDGLAGDELVPDLAIALPVPADRGRSYTFRLRPGVRYSTGALVRPEDFRNAIERVFVIDKRQDPYIMTFYADIVGAGRCESGSGPCNLARGIATDDAANTVTFRLRVPDPEFLYKLAFSWADAVPAGTPDHMISAARLPATGPYMTKSLVPGRTWILVRNPMFRQWARQAQPGGYPDRIVMRLNVPSDQAAKAVEHGRADVLLSAPPASIGQLATRYAGQLHSGPQANTLAFTLNTRVAPFSNLAARQAVNYAIDRNEVVALNGGPLTVQPTCQILPPALSGYHPYCPYTILPSASGDWTAPNLALARRLVRASGTRGDKVTVLGSNQGTLEPSLATGRYLVSVLDQLGYRATLRTTSPLRYYNVLDNSRERIQVGFFGWQADFPAPSDFIDPLFTCASFVPNSPANVNTAEFCDPRIDAQGQRALALQVGDPAEAAGQWARIDREIVNQAPWVPLYNPRTLTVVARRVGNYQFHPYWGLLIDQLWVR